MPKIKILAPELINKIAAGEVVESPASVVKELLDNAIDAGANNIRIEIEDSGYKRIRVLDDGFGMDREDLVNSLKLHATSKIQELDDLWNINSLGFRGEALASIASVSDFQIKSKTSDAEFGYEVKNSRDDGLDIKEVAMNQGTVVTVDNLFAKTPARLRFVNSKSYVMRNITQVVINMSLIFPQISFSLKHNGKDIMQVLSGDTRDARVRSAWGREISDHLLPFASESSYSKVTGYVGRPQIASRSKNRQYVFVNGRPVRVPAIARAIKDTYASLLAPREHPAFILFLDLPARSLDVNIHPRKEEVKILNQREMIDSIVEALEEVLSQNNLTYRLEDHNKMLGDFDEHSASILRDNAQLWSLKARDYSKAEIIQLHNTYLIAETEEGGILVDQHAAHERILFEELREIYKNLEKKLHILSEALVFDLPHDEASVLIDNIEKFEEMGFIIEEFGPNTFKITQIPDFFRDRDLVRLVKEVSDDLREGRSPKELDYQTERTIAYLACRSAIKAGDYLDMEERRRLLDKLQKTKTHYTCPHGRPSQIEISKQDLEVMFRRK